MSEKIGFAVTVYLNLIDKTGGDAQAAVELASDYLHAGGVGSKDCHVQLADTDTLWESHKHEIVDLLNEAQPDGSQELLTQLLKGDKAAIYIACVVAVDKLLGDLVMARGLVSSTHYPEASA